MGYHRRDSELQALKTMLQVVPMLICPNRGADTTPAKLLPRNLARVRFTQRLIVT